MLALIGAGSVAMAAACLRESWGNPGLGAWLAGAGRVAGLLTGYGAVAMVVLMARLPPVERAAGTGRLARWHLLGSRYVTGAAVAYALLAGWAHAVAAGAATAPGAGPLPGYPQTVMAAAAGLALLGINTALASGRIAYQAWYVLHACGYVAVIVIFSGQPARCVPDGIAWSVPIAAAAAVMWYRVITPVRCLARHQLRVVRVHCAGPDVVVDIGGVALPGLCPRPGQFLRWRFLACGMWWQSHPYPVTAAPGGDTLQITIRVRDRDGDAAARLRPGTRVTAEGPFTALAARGRRMLMLARGTGTGPVRAVLSALPPGAVTLIYHAGHPGGVCGEEIGAIAAARGARVYHVNGLGGWPETGPLSAPRLRGLFPAVARRDVYLCGPPAMTAAAVAALRRAGVPRSRIDCGPAGHLVSSARSRRLA